MKTFLLPLALSLTACSARQDLESERAYRQECDEQLAAAQQQLADLKTAQELADARLAAYRDLAEKLRAAFTDGDLQLIIRNGRLVVQLPNAILYESGSSELSGEGKATLARLARVLKATDRQLLIAGHTDNVPVRDKATDFSSNWELSTQRAISVVLFLESKEVPAARMAAAGYGEHQPVASNRTEEGRQQNRRMELIIMPTLDEIPELPGEL